MELSSLFSNHLLSLILFFPLIWGLIALVIPGGKSEQNRGIHRYWALFGSFITLLLSVYLYRQYNSLGENFQFIEKAPWIAEFGINYFLGIDGISLLLIVLTTALMPIVILGSFTAVKSKEKSYYFLLLFLQTGMIGAFVSLDVFLFYVFWEAMLIPMYFLIGIWGGKDKIYAAMKFFIYTMTGSLLMLVAIFYILFEHKAQFGYFSANIFDLYKVSISNVGGYFSPQGLLFLAFALAFAIKVPLFPFHTWLPDAHVQAPTAGSVILAGVLLKMGGYGFIRFAFPLFPSAIYTYQTVFLILGSIAIVYGALMALVQEDVKKLVAYSSVSHMGYVVLGLFSFNLIGISGSMYQMLNHGISTGALFLLVGMIYERRHTRELSEFGGIAKVMPLFTIAFMIITFSAVALPGTNGFVGEFLILLGTWKTSHLAAAIAGLGVIFGAVYMLLATQKMFFGENKNEKNFNLKDLSFREIIILLPLIFLVFYMGVQPTPILKKMEPSLNHFVSQIQSSQNIADVEKNREKFYAKFNSH